MHHKKLLLSMSANPSLLLTHFTPSGGIALPGEPTQEHFRASTPDAGHASEIEQILLQYTLSHARSSLPLDTITLSGQAGVEYG